MAPITQPHPELKAENLWMIELGEALPQAAGIFAYVQDVPPCGFNRSASLRFLFIDVSADLSTLPGQALDGKPAHLALELGATHIAFRVLPSFKARHAEATRLQAKYRPVVNRLHRIPSAA